MLGTAEALAAGRGETVAGPGNSCRAWEAGLGDLRVPNSARSQLSTIPLFPKKRPP